jgi:hypothetical protein
MAASKEWTGTEGVERKTRLVTGTETRQKTAGALGTETEPMSGKRKTWPTAGKLEASCALGRENELGTPARGPETGDRPAGSEWRLEIGRAEKPNRLWQSRGLDRGSLLTNQRATPRPAWSQIEDLTRAALCGTKE